MVGLSVLYFLHKNSKKNNVLLVVYYVQGLLLYFPI